MFKNKTTVHRYTVIYDAPFKLPRQVVVHLDKTPTFDQMKKFIIHLKDKANGHATDPTISAFYRDQYRTLADSLLQIYNQLACAGVLQREYKQGRVSIIRELVQIKGFGK